MSQVCKFYLRGSCKYGHRCHFLHEDPYDYSQGRSSQHYRNENYSQKHSYPHVNSHNSGYAHHNYEKDYSHSYSRHHAQTYYNNSSRPNYVDNSYAAKQSYNRYHVDNRQNQRELRNSESISVAEFLEVVNIELMQHQQSHMWPFTVIAPIKDFGNIPGFKDWSPEEVRCQYYESTSKNTLYDFEENVRNALNEVMERRQVFRLKSSEALNILKTMMQESKNARMNINVNTSAASTFSFDLRNLNANQSPTSVDMNTQSGTNFSFNSLQDINPVYFQANAQGLPRSGTSPSFLAGNPTTSFNVANELDQADSQINTFSFNINHIKSNLENPVQPNGIHFHPELPTDINDSIYSNLGQLPTDAVEKFKAKIFRAGKIPLCPPPKELCIS